MLLFPILLSAQAAEPGCLEPAAQTELAWSVYQSAEIEAAAEHLAQAEAALSCQSDQVSAQALLELFWLRALVALSADDTAEMERALRRSIAVDHTQRPPVAYGPELRSTWERLALQGSRVTVVVEGALPAWIDGRRVEPGGSLQIASGTHLVQVPDGLAVSSRLVDVLVSETISTGGVPEPLPPPPPVVRSGKRPPVLVIATLAAGAASAWAIGSGVRSERSFRASSYNAVSYDFCRYDDARCYPTARGNAIRADASRINAAYGVGYGLAAVTSGLITLTVVGLPERLRDR